MLLDLVFQLVTSMVGAQCDFHRFILLKAAAPRPPQNEKTGQSAGSSVQRRTSGPENSFVSDCGTKLVPRKPQCQSQVRAIRKAKTFRGVPRLHREYALAIALKANVRLCLGGFSSDNHARIFPRTLIEVTNRHSARA